MLASSPHRRWSAVDIASVVDVDDVEEFELFVYGIDDSIAAAAGATQTGQLASQRTANSQRFSHTFRTIRLTQRPVSNPT
jgi:hypothetical protein